MAVTADTAREAPSSLVAAAAVLGRAVLHSYAQIYFSRSRVVGLLMLGATLLQPRVGLMGLLALIVATAAAYALRFDAEQIGEGIFGYNALLIGLAGAASYEPTGGSVGITLAVAAATPLVTAALRSALGYTFNLPALSMPFVLVFFVLLGAAPFFGMPPALGASAAFIAPNLPVQAALYLKSLGAIFFLPRVDVGLLLLVALLLHSRIAVVYSLLGFAVALLLLGTMAGDPGPALPVVLGFNFLLVAVALGGFFFVPSVSSALFALAGAAVCGLVALGLFAPLTRLGLPLLILPFNLAVILLLYAMRQRSADSLPKSVDFVAGTPEENLNYYHTRVARFGARYAVRFSAPFRGRWTCTQAVDGPHTHKGKWRHGLDFEVAGEDGQMHEGSGARCSDYHCYRLPVIAAADGTVAKVVDDVPDNAVGEVNLRNNWGNVVVIYHGPLLYSMVAHLAPGTIKVQEGQVVRRGDTLGLCGSSGRSPVPHLHFQLQANARLGSPTLPIELHDVIKQEAGEGVADAQEWMTTTTPREGDVLRNIDADPQLAGLLAFPFDRALRFAVQGGGRRHEETLEAEIDLLGAYVLRSSRGGALYYEPSSRLLTMYDVIGDRRSVLHLLLAALARVPAESAPTLRWSDHLPQRRFSPAPLIWLSDAWSPFVPPRGMRMDYRVEREDGGFVIRGVATQNGRRKALTTEAHYDTTRGLVALALTRGTSTVRAERLFADEKTTPRSER